MAANLTRESADSESQLARLTERLQRSEQRLAEIDAALVEGELARSRLDEDLGACRGPARASWRPSRRPRGSSGCTGRCRRPTWPAASARPKSGWSGPSAVRAEAEAAALALGGELAQLDQDDSRAHDAAGGVARSPRGARGGAARAGARRPPTRKRPWRTRSGRSPPPSGKSWSRAARWNPRTRRATPSRCGSPRRPAVAGASWSGSKPSGTGRFDQLLERRADARPRPRDPGGGVGADRRGPRVHRSGERAGRGGARRRGEAARVPHRPARRPGGRPAVAASRRSGRSTAPRAPCSSRPSPRSRPTSSRVFQTLFGGGECELRLANPDDPLESEIDIHAAPRGKRTQRIHLLSLGRAHAGGGLPAVQHLPHQAQPVLPDGRGGRAAGRRQRRPVHPAAGRVQERHPVPGHHSQSRGRCRPPTRCTA